MKRLFLARQIISGLVSFPIPRDPFNLLHTFLLLRLRLKGLCVRRMRQRGNRIRWRRKVFLCRSGYAGSHLLVSPLLVIWSGFSGNFR